ncbi:MAG: CpsD/CapB family tyrosine-protein kinase [Breznakibacter sp.]
MTVSSTDAGEGKTFVSVNLASVYAVSGKRTVLVGLDLRKPRLGDIFGFKERIGVSNYLIGQAAYEEILVPSGQNNLVIIPSGEIPPNPSELIASDRMGKLLAQLRQDFEVIVIDTPPIGLVSDARLLMSDTDAVLYVVRCNVSHKEYLRHTVQNLIGEGVHPIGIIFNDVVNRPKGYGNYSSEYYGKVKG